MTDHDLARLLHSLADTLERHQQAVGAGLVREAARRLALGRDRHGLCRCGAAIQQPWTGRRRKWCHACRPSFPRETAA